MDTQILMIGLAGAAAGSLLGWALAARSARRRVSAEAGRAAGLLEAARLEAEALRKQASLEGQELAQKERDELEEKIRRKVESLKNFERKLQSKQQSLSDRLRNAQEREVDAGKAREEAEAAIAETTRRRERLLAQEADLQQRLAATAGVTVEDARRQLFEALRTEAQNEAAHLIRDIKKDAIRRAELEALNIVSLAIERVAVDQVFEKTTGLIKLADPQVKGRIIGQEGKNIRAFEDATGMQLMVNELPDAVVVSGFNPVKREIARMSMERLIQGGAIHPRKIEEVVKKCEKKVQGICRRAGEEALKYLGIQQVHPEVLKVFGNLRYRTSYGQNVLNHSVEVAELCRGMAMEMGLDPLLAARAGLFHDLGKGVDFEREGTHPELGAELARKFGEHDVVINAIESHHEDVPANHPISSLVAACDAISGGRPGARRQSSTDYAKRIESLEAVANSFDGVDYSYAIQAGRQLRVMVKPTLVDDAQVDLLSDAIAKKISSEMDFPGRIKVVVIREMHAVETAS